MPGGRRTTTREYRTGELDLMQLSDSLFPTGLFALSNGVESLFHDGAVSTAAGLIEFCATCIEQQLGPCDCVLLSNTRSLAASREYGGIREMDAICAATRVTREVREASFRSGAQLARCVAEFSRGDAVLDWYRNEIRSGEVTGAYPVALAICCNALGIDGERGSLLLLYGFVASSVGAALRLGMIQHFEGQRVIHELKPLMAKTAAESSQKRADEIWQFLPQIEINQMAHERMDPKMFIT